MLRFTRLVVFFSCLLLIENIVLLPKFPENSLPLCIFSMLFYSFCYYMNSFLERLELVNDLN